jgi:plastocyanin
MQRRVTVVAGLALGAILMASGAISAAQESSATVTIDNFAYAPAQITVAVGTRVVWTNGDDIPHTVTDAGQPRAYKSAALDTDEVFSYIFRTPGTYQYFCSLHPHMQGTVVVK